MQRFARLLVAVLSLGVTDDCDGDAEATRRFFTGASLFLGVVSALWGAMTRAYADDVPQIDGYGGERNQVWTNILDNAVGAMDGQGAVRISTGRSGDHAVLEVIDNEPGVPADIAAERIFDPFVTTKAPGEGTGLGLSISHNIVTREHGGEKSLAFQPGATTFTVRLPIAGLSQNSQDPRRTECAGVGRGSNKE